MSQKDNFSRLMAVLAILISIGSIVISIRSCNLTERRMKLHLKPNLMCILVDHPQKEHFMLFTLKNEGPIDATSVIIDHVTLRYPKKEKKIRFEGLSGGSVLEYNEPGKRWIFKDKLLPNEKLHKLTGDFALRDASTTIDVLLFDITYYRDSDGEVYNKHREFYIEGETIYTKSQFRSHDSYSEVVTEVSRFLGEILSLKHRFHNTKQ